MADMSSSDSGPGVGPGNPHGLPPMPGAGPSSLCDASLLAASSACPSLVSNYMQPSQPAQMPNGGAGASPPLPDWMPPGGTAPAGFPVGMPPFATQGPATGVGAGSPTGAFLGPCVLTHGSPPQPGQPAAPGGLLGDGGIPPGSSGAPPMAAAQMASQNPHLLPASMSAPQSQMHAPPAPQSSVHSSSLSPPSSNMSSAAVGSAAFAQQLAAFSSSVGSSSTSHTPSLPVSSSSSQFLLPQYRPPNPPSPFSPSVSLTPRSAGSMQNTPGASGAQPLFPVGSVVQNAMPMHPQAPGVAPAGSPNGPPGPGATGPAPLGAVAAPGTPVPGVGPSGGPLAPPGAGTPGAMGTPVSAPGASQGNMQPKAFWGAPCAVPAVSLRNIEISATSRMHSSVGLWSDARRRRPHKKPRTGAEQTGTPAEAEAATPEKDAEDGKTGGDIVLDWIEKEGLGGLHRLLVDALLMPAPKTTNGSRLVSLAARAAQLPPVPGVVYDPHQYQFLARYFETEESAVPITKRFPLRRWGFFKSYRFACDVVQQAARPGVFEDGEIAPVKETLPGFDGQSLTGPEAPPEYYVLPDCPDVSLPVIKGVSRDKKSRRWAVYYRNQRRYFYDRKEEKPTKEKKEKEDETPTAAAASLSPHAGVKEAYEMAVQLRRQQVQEVELLQMYEESNSGASQGDDMTLLLPCYQAVLLALLHDLEKNVLEGGLDEVLARVVGMELPEPGAAAGARETGGDEKTEEASDSGEAKDSGAQEGEEQVKGKGEEEGQEGHATKPEGPAGGGAGQRKEPEELKLLRQRVADIVASHLVYIQSAALAVELHEHLAILRDCIQKQVLPSHLPPAARLLLVVKFLELQLGSLRDALVQSGFYRQILVDGTKRQKKKCDKEKAGEGEGGTATKKSESRPCLLQGKAQEGAAPFRAAGGEDASALPPSAPHTTSGRDVNMRMTAQEKELTAPAGEQREMQLGA
ncbi:AP2 domain transcription factor AP2X-4 [Besnoitia besnoiti]|uniref:AP2 domain transcription factor AP2X-4 n=1 Tax=Besnoitia besnoiti TaxID=94643 RepID=A0A2A9M710_BESBE|nr:AP2 domain transcription factor AP2X-4 [Besnoitia besnoiti]PFH33739.1 AP2 domain transcription factor AP2X-4 [Besnoitia besnoiti]